MYLILLSVINAETLYIYFNLYLQKCNNLETVQTQLRYELDKVRKERDALQTAYRQHMTICPLQYPLHLTVASSTGENT